MIDVLILVKCRSQEHATSNTASWKFHIQENGAWHVTVIARLSYRGTWYIILRVPGTYLQGCG